MLSLAHCGRTWHDKNMASDKSLYDDTTLATAQKVIKSPQKMSLHISSIDH